MSSVRFESQKQGHKPEKKKRTKPPKFESLKKRIIDFIGKFDNNNLGVKHIIKEVYDDITKELSELQVFGVTPGYNEIPCCTIMFSSKIGSTGRNTVTVHKLAPCTLPASICKEFTFGIVCPSKKEDVVIMPESKSEILVTNVPPIKKIPRPKLSKEERMRKKKWFCSLPDVIQKRILDSMPDPSLRIKKLEALTPSRIKYYVRRMVAGQTKRFCPFCGNQTNISTCCTNRIEFYRCSVCNKQWVEEKALVNIKEYDSCKQL